MQFSLHPNVQSPSNSVWLLSTSNPPPKYQCNLNLPQQTLCGFLKLSNSSPKATLHILLGELPLEGNIHIATRMLFHNIWSSPYTTVHKQVKYIQMMTRTNPQPGVIMSEYFASSMGSLSTTASGKLFILAKDKMEEPGHNQGDCSL